MEVSFDDPHVRATKLKVHQSIAERIDGRVCVAQKVRKHVHMTIDTATESFHHC